VLVAGVSGASITIGTVALKGMALGTVVAIVVSLVMALFDRFRLANDQEHPAVPERA
jgi:uracil permease